METGTPYVLFKDACNRKSNQQNLGTIRSSNLCTEILEYTSPDEVSEWAWTEAAGSPRAGRAREGGVGSVRSLIWVKGGSKPWC